MCILNMKSTNSTDLLTLLIYRRRKILIGKTGHFFWNIWKPSTGETADSEVNWSK